MPRRMNDGIAVYGFLVTSEVFSFIHTMSFVACFLHQSLRAQVKITSCPLAIPFPQPHFESGSCVHLPSRLRFARLQIHHSFSRAPLPRARPHLPTPQNYEYEQHFLNSVYDLAKSNPRFIHTPNRLQKKFGKTIFIFRFVISWAIK